MSNPMDDPTGRYESGPVYSSTLLNAMMEKPSFPITITIGGEPFKLNADGSWSGDIQAVRKAVRESKGCFGDAGILLWLVLREMERDALLGW